MLLRRSLGSEERVAAAALFLHEPLGTARLLGVALVGTGVILLVRSPR